MHASGWKYGQIQGQRKAAELMAAGNRKGEENTLSDHTPVTQLLQNFPGA